MDEWERKMIEFVRRGQKDRVQYLDKLHKSMLPMQLKRIQQNDKTVIKDLVLPKWLEWDLLFEWSNRKKVVGKTRECILCNEEQDFGMEFKEKFICDNCFLKLKNLE